MLISQSKPGAKNLLASFMRDELLLKLTLKNHASLVWHFVFLLFSPYFPAMVQGIFPAMIVNTIQTVALDMLYSAFEKNVMKWSPKRKYLNTFLQNSSLGCHMGCSWLALGGDLEKNQITLIKHTEHNLMYPASLRRVKKVSVQNGVLLKGTGKVVL